MLLAEEGTLRKFVMTVFGTRYLGLSVSYFGLIL